MSIAERMALAVARLVRARIRYFLLKMGAAPCGRSTGAHGVVAGLCCLVGSAFLGGCAAQAPAPTAAQAAQAALVRLDTESLRHVRHDDAWEHRANRPVIMRMDVSAVRPLLERAPITAGAGALGPDTANGAGLAPQAVLPDGQELHIDAQHPAERDSAALTPGDAGRGGGNAATSIDIPNADGSITHVEPDGTVRTEKLLSRDRAAAHGVKDGD